MKNTYISEQKQSITERYISGGETYSQINADTGVAKSTFYSWLKKYNVEKETTKKKRLTFATLCCLKARLNGLKIWLIY